MVHPYNGSNFHFTGGNLIGGGSNIGPASGRRRISDFLSLNAFLACSAGKDVLFNILTSGDRAPILFPYREGEEELNPT